jgi:hypothetical protein
VVSLFSLTPVNPSTGSKLQIRQSDFHFGASAEGAGDADGAFELFDRLLDNV